MKKKLKDEIAELEKIREENNGVKFKEMALNGEISKPALVYFIEQENLFNTGQTPQPTVIWALKAAFTAITERYIKKQVLIAIISAGIAFISALIAIWSNL